MIFGILFVSLLCVVESALFKTNSKEYRYFGNDVGSPLFLTPYIEKSLFQKAIALSHVGSVPGIEATSFSGYITVNKTYNSNLFFWFWPAVQDPDKAPVVVWLQGGPGGSSLFGLFNENGPYWVDSTFTPRNRKITWNAKYSMLYIDNPVGTGYSFTDSVAGYAGDEVQVANELYSFFVQFFQMFFILARNDFYLSGESYAGKYIPAAAYKIHLENSNGLHHINLKGVAIGDGWVDPITMIPAYSNLVYNFAMIDNKEREYFISVSNKIVSLLHEAKWMDAANILTDLFMDERSSYFINVTGFHNYYNILRVNNPKDYVYYEKFVTSETVRKAIHVGNMTYNDGATVYFHLKEDFVKSEKAALAVVMDNYKVLLYNGQLDICVAPTVTEAMLGTVPWGGASAFAKSQKSVWKLKERPDDVAGYAKCYKRFCQVMVRTAGHILPYDQPERAFDMISRFIEEKPFS